MCSGKAVRRRRSVATILARAVTGKSGRSAAAAENVTSFDRKKEPPQGAVLLLLGFSTMNPSLLAKDPIFYGSGHRYSTVARTGAQPHLL